MLTSDPSSECSTCPRLVSFRKDWRRSEPSWFNAPVPTFGDPQARLLIVGLAPGLRGANRTGRPFTGDYAGDLLYETLGAFGLARGSYGARPDDGLELVQTAITNAVRCVPPENKPTSAEMAACRPFLAGTLAAFPHLIAILALGRIAHDNTLSAFGIPRTRHAFGHAAEHRLPSGLYLYDSYHCSRYNTNTGRLTAEMFRAVFSRINERLLGRA